MKNVRPKRPVHMQTVQTKDLKNMLKLIDYLSVEKANSNKVAWSKKHRALYDEVIWAFHRYNIEPAVIVRGALPNEKH